jgi:hypothetical protein
MSKRIVVALLVVAGCQGGAPGADAPQSGELDVLQQAATNAAGTAPQSVKVVNTAADWAAPVPTAQSGSWTVNAVQSGPWNMSLAPGGIVNIGNIPTVSLTPGTAVNVGTVLNPVSISSLPDVNIANLPPVSVANLPSMQTVSGTVAVSNLPATQTVNGTVAVTNLPTTQTVSGTVSVSNLPTTQPVSGSVSISNLPSTQPVSGNVTVTPSGGATFRVSGADVTETVYSGTPTGVNSPDLDVSAFRQVRVSANVICNAPSTARIEIRTREANWTFALADTGPSTQQDAVISQAFDIPGTTIFVEGSCIDGQTVLAPSQYNLAVVGRR